MKTVFWNVDTQNDFIDEKGSLYVPEAELIRPNLGLLTRYAKTNGIYVVNTGDWHNESSKEIGKSPDYIKKFPRHCIIKTKGAEFIEETSPENPYTLDWREKTFDKNKVIKTRNLILYKDNLDVFKGNPHTEKSLRIIHPDNIVVYGVATDFCIREAVIGMVKRNYQVYVVSDAIKGVSPKKTSEALDEMIESGVRFISTKEILEGGRK